MEIFLLIYLSSCLSQETAKWPLRSSSQAATCYYQCNHSKGRCNPVKCLSKNTSYNLSAYFHTTGISLLRQARKLWIPTFKVLVGFDEGIQPRSTDCIFTFCNALQYRLI